MQDSGYHERRKEQRLQYHWPIWFSQDSEDNFSQGQMVDISSKAASFTCEDDGSCPDTGQEITAQFSVPHYADDESFDMPNFTRTGQVFRVENINHYHRKIAIEFAAPLPFKPGEQKAVRAAFL